MHLEICRRTLVLAHDFTISRWSSSEKHNIFVTFTHEGVSGSGEAAPNLRYGETPESATLALEQWGQQLKGNPLDFENFLDSLSSSDQWAARAALDMAVMDWVGKKQNLPLYRIWGLEAGNIAPTSMTIAIASPSDMAQRAIEAEGFYALKVKLGTPDDQAMIRAIRQVSNQVIRVDANEGWKDRETAIREIDWLAGQNIELVEQPMPAEAFEDMIWLKQRSSIPLIADEAFTHDLTQIGSLAEAYHGVNIKLMKTGGSLNALRAIRAAQGQNLKIMLGCMIESGLGIAAALHLAPLADYVDLDGNLLINNDPFTAHPLDHGCHQLLDLPGLGVHVR